MKRMILALTLTLLTSLFVTLPAAAAAEYGVIYTEAETLQSAELTALGQQELPQFTETYGIDLRVDVLTSIGEFSSMEELAPVLYENYGYGYGEGRNGMTLTLLVHEDEDGVAMDRWYVYASGDSDGLVTDGVRNVLSVVEAQMGEEHWAGDAAQDTRSLAAAVRAMREELETFVLSGGVADTIWDPAGQEAPAEVPPDSFPAAGEVIGYVTDTAGIMTAEERQALEQAAQAISEKHGFGVYIITVDSFRDVTDSYDVFDGATTLYNKYDLGLGEERKGVLLLLSMTGRDFSLVTYSDYGNYVFDAETREAVSDYFLDDFSADDWYNGFADYLSVSDGVLMEGPEKLKSEINALIGIIFLVPLIIAAIVIAVLGQKMKSVFRATQAGAYAGDLDLTQSYDRFTHATETRKKRKEESSSGGRTKSTKSSSSGGFGGTSGKF